VAERGKAAAPRDISGHDPLQDSALGT
jgi:hypothetical protein